MILASLALGIHLASAHAPAREGQKNVNPGIYLRTEDGLTAGLYHNTLDRPSAYVGLTAEAGPFSLTAGLISGYQMKRRGATCAEAKQTVRRDIGQCWIDEGYSRGAVTPFLAPSVRLPLADQWAGRLTYLSLHRWHEPLSRRPLLHRKDLPVNLNPFRTIPLIEQVERLLGDAHEALIVDELELRRSQARVKMSVERLRYLEAKHTELCATTPRSAP